VNRYEQLAFEKGYRVVNGCVISSNGKRRSLYLKNCGERRLKYPAFSVYVGIINGKRKIGEVKVHRLVAYQKYGMAIYDSGVCVRHLDGNPENFSEDNICIGTQSQNMMDIPQNIRLINAKMAALTQRKFSDNDVRKIRNSYESGTSLNELCAEHKTSKSTMSYIVNRKTYSDETVLSNHG
jgi:hypothetical protein